MAAPGITSSGHAASLTHRNVFRAGRCRVNVKVVWAEEIGDKEEEAVRAEEFAPKDEAVSAEKIAAKEDEAVRARETAPENEAVQAKEIAPGKRLCERR